ncbi:cellulose binding domain-containing protein [Streptosporangiaceae bacterium NEAU-GS5]|nr:cellulose binding domain-containing protein [Streptosporangiaceae bacterium NEAU-GS5]
MRGVIRVLVGIALVGAAVFGITGPAQAVATCTATYSITRTWVQGTGNGFVGEIVVTPGTDPISGWTVSWAYTDGQRISTMWNGISLAPSLGSIGVYVYGNAVWNGGGGTIGFVGTSPGVPAPPALMDCAAR